MAVNANTELYDKTVDRAAMIRRYEKMVSDKVFLELDGHQIRVDKLIRDAKLSEGGYRKLRNAIDEELQRTYKRVYQTSKRSLLDLAGDQLSYTYQSMEAATSKVWRTKRPYAYVGEDIVLNRPLASDKNLAQGWAGVSASERKRLESVIIRGISEGSSVEEIAKNIRTGNVHNITRNQSKALVITSITSVTAQADFEVYKANEKALSGWQYIAVLDSRTTPVCRHRDGEIYGMEDTKYLPPAHFRCRSTTVPVVKSWAELSTLENVAQVRKRNIAKLSPQQLAYYEGRLPTREGYGDWLRRQNKEVQLRHLGSEEKVGLFNSGQLSIDKFADVEGKPVGIRQLRQLTDSEYTVSGDTLRFANAKRKLDSLHLGFARPEDILNDINAQNRLREYYKLQAGELDGTLSLTNYRGLIIGNKRNMKTRVLTRPPTEDQLKYNPVTGRYEDTRLYQPAPDVFNNNLRLVNESSELLERDKSFISSFVNSLDDYMGVNERAVVTDNLRIIFTRYRKNPQAWGNFKAVTQAQIKFDVMNVSDAIETQIRKDSDILKKLLQDNYIDPVLGVTQLDDLGSNLLKNISAKNRWEDKVAPKVANDLRSVFDIDIPFKLKSRMKDNDLDQFYTRFAHRLALADSPDRDQLAVALGRDLYNMANLNGSRNQWYNLGDKLLSSTRASNLFEIETFGVQKRRMKSRMSGRYFGPYYDTLGYNIRIVDPRIQEYAKLTRSIEVGMRVPVTDPSKQLLVRKNYKTYFMKSKFGYEDTRIPITSTSSFSDFPEDFIDDNMVKALNWAGKSQYKVDEDFYDFTRKLLYFEDDKGKAKYYNSLNEYKKYIASRGDSYERFKAMEWLRKGDKSFSNTAFIDHRARIYDRGFIGPQSGETLNI